MDRGQFNNNGIFPIYEKRGYHRSVWLISVPIERFLRGVRCFLRESDKMLVTKALLGRDAFTLRSFIANPKESPSLHFNQLIYMVYVLTN